MKNSYTERDLVTLQAGEAYKTGQIYIITNDINDKVYVGQTIHSLQYRLTKHSNDSNVPIDGVNYAIQKYGIQHFNIQLLEKVLRAEMDQKERDWIAHYNSYVPFGYNLTHGGQEAISYKLSDEQCNQCISLYLQGETIEHICQYYDISTSTLYSVLHTANVKLRQNKTEVGYQACVANFQKATETRQVRVYNKTLDKIYISKKAALIDMIESGHSKAANWHNIRGPLDRALKGLQDTAFGFQWEVLDEAI